MKVGYTFRFQGITFQVLHLTSAEIPVVGRRRPDGTVTHNYRYCTHMKAWDNGLSASPFEFVQPKEDNHDTQK